MCDFKRITTQYGSGFAPIGSDQFTGLDHIVVDGRTFGICSTSGLPLNMKNEYGVMCCEKKCQPEKDKEAAESLTAHLDKIYGKGKVIRK